MVFLHTFFSIESPKIAVECAFVFKFLFDIVFALSLLESELSLIGSFRLDQEKSLLVSAFFIFNDF